MCNLKWLLLLFVGFNAFGQAMTEQPMPPGYTYQQTRQRNDFFIDHNNNYWIAFNTIGLGKYDGTNWTVYDSLNSGLPVNKIIAIAEDASGNIIAGTNEGISIFNGAAWMNYNILNSPLPAGGITTLSTSVDKILIGTNSGLFTFENGVWNNYSISNSQIINDSITAITSGNTSLIVVGTRDGISVIRQNSWVSFTTFNSILTNDYIKDVAVTASGEIWLLNKTGRIYLINLHHYILIPLSDIIPQREYDCSPYIDKNLHAIETIDDDIYITLNGENFKSLLKIKNGGEFFVTYDFPNSTFQPVLRMRNNKIAWSAAQLNGLSSASGFYAGNITDLHFEKFTSYFYNPDMLDVNQVRAKINSNGSLHWDPVGQTNYYTVPKCSYKNTVYSSGLWIGGLDNNNQLHSAAETYRQAGAVDFWNGPLDTITGMPDSVGKIAFNPYWKINKITIDEFISNYTLGNVSNGTYEIPDIILEWPANSVGNTTKDLAPYFDNNSDGIYNPHDGDYPCISGDQFMWYVYNDAERNHTETFGRSMGIEIQASVYAYDGSTITDTTVIDYTGFYHFKITNYSDTAYHDVYIGMYSDFDLGNAADDYVQCNPNYDYFFAYNGDPDDDGASGYGINPPIQSVAFLKGPDADENDGHDNNHNGTTDENDEFIGLTNFLHYYGSNFQPTSNPQDAKDYYNYLHSVWQDDSHVTFGGQGYQGAIPCNFMYPGDEDYNFPGQNWTMPGAGRPPDDTRGLGSSGPFTLLPGETKTLDLAYIFTRDSSGGVFPDAAIAHNKAEVIKVKQFWKDHYNTPCTKISAPVTPEITTPEIYFYPNPVANELLFTAPETDFNGAQYEIYDALGQLCKTGILSERQITVKNLASQLYIVKIKNKEQEYFGKFLKE